MVTSLKSIRIGTRKSPLALWQAEFVRNELLKLEPTLQVELIKLTTQGDKMLAPTQRVDAPNMHPFI